MVIAHNIEANFTGRKLGRTNKALAKSSEKLSTSYRVNRAADDASGLAVSEGMRGQIRGLNRGAMNTEEAVGFCQVADGAMQEIENIVHRIRELSVQSADDTNTEQDRVMIQHEIDQLVAEVDHITRDTEYNSIKVFNDYAINIEGKNYGLSTILGTDHVCQKDKMEEEVDFLDAGWNNTGKDESDPSSPYSIKLNNILTEIQNITGGSITIPVTPPAGTTSVTVSSANNDYTATVQYDNVKHDGTKLLPSRVVLIDNTGQTSNNRSYSIDSIGTKGMGSSTQYHGAWMDFEGLGKNYKLSDLYGQGFNTGCMHCVGQKRYNVLFTGDACETTNAAGVNYTFTSVSKGVRIYNTLTVNLSGCKSGEEIVKRIMSAANSATGFTNHYIQLAYKNAEPGKLYVYDNVPGSKRSEFEPAVRNENGLVVETGRSLGIQVGSNASQLVTIEQPYMNAKRLGLTMLDLTTRESAGYSIDACDNALDILNIERAYIGSMTNRLSHAYDNNKNEEENIQFSESLIRDLDMADEMVKYSASKIVQQAAQSMLSQANSSKDGVLAMFR